MRRRKIIIAISIVTAFLFFTVLIGIKVNQKLTSDNYKFVIGMSQANLYEPWRVNMNDEIKKEAEKHDNIKMIYKDAGGDIEKQKSDIDDLINFGVDLLIVSINDSEQLSSSVRDAYKCIPVIVLDTSTEGDNYTLYIGSDTKSIGEKAGELVAELSQGADTNVVEIQGALNSSPDKEITQGFKSTIEKYKNISIGMTVIADWQKCESQDKIDELLDNNENMNIIFAHSDYMALGAYYSIKEHKKENCIKIIGANGLEGEDGGIDLVKKGILSGTFKCETGGKEAIQYALKILNKQEDIPKKIILKCDEITTDTLKNKVE